jgi:lipopolysaccharide transport system ATP-binding protein
MIDLEFNRVSKKYRVRAEEEVGATGHPLLRELQRLRRRSEDFWAVRDVSFQVGRGETLGVIGHNGAGKSTILKLLSSITAPTAGEIRINGRLSALIEVGSGFHPELSGRENVFLSGSILGMRRREIAGKLESIIEFAGVRQFIDTPVKRYSSGMYVRLGFAIAAHLDPDVLLLDEVLAVGDAAFQAKCFERINELHKSGTTIVFISHDLGAVERLCSRALLMDHGQIAADGNTSDVVKRYGELAKQKEVARSSQQSMSPGETGDVVITGCDMFGADGLPRRDFEFGEALRVRIELYAARRIPFPLINFGIKRTDGVIACNFNNCYDNFKIDYLEGHCTLEGWLPPLRLIPYSYEIHALVWQRKASYENGDLTGLRPLAANQFGEFTIHGPALAEDGGVFQQPALKWIWTVNGRSTKFDDINLDSVYKAFNEESTMQSV